MPDRSLSSILGGLVDTIGSAIGGAGELIGNVVERGVELLPPLVEAGAQIAPIFFPPEAPTPTFPPQQPRTAQPFPTPLQRRSTMPTFFPGGAPVQQAAFPLIPTLGAGAAGGLAQGLAERFFGGGGAVDLPRGGLLYRQLPMRVAPQPRIMQQNPLNPAVIDVWEYAGRPVLYSRDIRCTRRVRKIASRARRFR